MKEREIKHLLKNDLFQGQGSDPQLAETHISWVILTERYAYKIKKPVKFSILDFSTLEKRKYYCEQEVTLNKRLADSMYLNVVPIFQKDDHFSFNADDDHELIDYAVLMNRMDSAKEMDKLLQNNDVNGQAIAKLAQKMAAFHQGATVITGKFSINHFKQRFNDIQSLQDKVNGYLGTAFANIISQAVKKSDWFLEHYKTLLEERSFGGYFRDVHGDLHTANIFLYEDPVVFDCIEFNDDLRQIDILDEIAFLCMDLDAYGRNDLSKLFYQDYLQHSGMKENEESRLLFRYYQFYRSSVRAKVNVLYATETTSKNAVSKRIENASRYLSLLDKYLSEF